MKVTIILFLSLAFCPAVLALSLEEIKLPEPKLSRLSNGLTVAWFERDSIPVVDLIFVSKAGYRNDPLGKAGATELLSAMMARGAGEYSDLDFSKEIEKLGAGRVVSADDDSFTIGVHGLAADASRLLELLSKQVISPLLLENDFGNMHGKILDRLNHIGDGADALSSLVFHRITANGTEYYRAGFASKKEFVTVRYADILAQYKRIINPSNSLLIIIGRMKKDSFSKNIEKEFGHWSPPASKLEAVSTREKKFSISTNKIVFIGRKDLTQAEIRMGFKFIKPESNERYAAAVFNALMGEYFNSRLNTVLRDQLGLTYSVSSSLSYNHSYGRWVLSAATRNEKVGEFLKRCHELLKKSVVEGVSETEVSEAKAYLLGSYPIGMSTLSAIASRWLVGQIYGMDASFLNAYRSGIAAVTKSDVDNWVKKYFKIEQMTKVVSGDEGSVQKSLNQAGFKSIQKLKVDELLK